MEELTSVPAEDHTFRNLLIGIAASVLSAFASQFLYDKYKKNKEEEGKANPTSSEDPNTNSSQTEPPPQQAVVNTPTTPPSNSSVGGKSVGGKLMTMPTTFKPLPKPAPTTVSASDVKKLKELLEKYPGRNTLVVGKKDLEITTLYKKNNYTWYVMTLKAEDATPAKLQLAFRLKGTWKKIAIPPHTAEENNLSLRYRLDTLTPPYYLSPKDFVKMIIDLETKFPQNPLPLREKILNN